MKMHSTKLSSSSNTKQSSSSVSTTATNTQQYQYPSIATLRRASRPSNINIPAFDHNNTQAPNDPGIYSAPICYIKQPNNQQQQQPPQHIYQTSQPYTAALPYPTQQHIQISSHPHSQQQNIHLYQQQPQQIVESFTDYQNTPRTFPLQASPNHCRQYFIFPTSNLPINVTRNGHQSANTNQPSTPTQLNLLRSTQRQDATQVQQSQQQWSNPVLSSLMVKRMNENPGPMSIDDNEDHSASIDALVADIDSNSQDILDDEQNKSLNQSKTSSTMPLDTIPSLSHVYIRSKSHILTTPPNPLASDDHPDNQLNIANNYKTNYSPLPSAGFELTTNINNKTLSSSNTVPHFTFETNLLETARELKNQHNENLVDDKVEVNNNIISKPLIINTDKRISSNSLIQDDNSNHSSTNSSSQNTSSRIFGQMLKSSEKHILTSSSPLSNDIKLSASADLDNMQAHIQQNRHLCTHPDCNKTFTNKSALAKHKLTHSQDRKHVCQKCNKGFKRLDHLNGHMLTHEEEKPHKCLVQNCNRTYCDARSLKRHIENTHQEILTAIYERGNEEYKRYLPESAIVKTKDLSLHSEFSVDSVDSNSPRSLNDAESTFNTRTSTGTRTTIYTYDEEKCIECTVCKKTFKNGAALNGHMRLHGGFLDKQTPSPSTVPKEKSKRSTTTKRKRIDSPSISPNIKREAQDIPRIPSRSIYQQQPSHPNLLTNLNTFQKQFYDVTRSSPVHSSSPPTMISLPPTIISQYTGKPYIQSTMKSNVKRVHIPTLGLQSSYPNIPNLMMPFDSLTNSPLFTNVSSPLQQYEEKSRESSTNDNNNTNLMQLNGMSPYNRSSPYQLLSTMSPFYRSPSPAMQTNPTSPIVLQLFHTQKSEEFKSPQQTCPSTKEDLPLLPRLRSIDPSMSNTTSTLNMQTLVTSLNSNQHTSHHDPPSSPTQKCNTNTNNMSTIPKDNSMQSSLQIASQKSLENLIDDYKQEKTIDNVSTSSPTTLEIVPDVDDSPTKKTMSGFLISTPSSTATGLSSSSSTSSNTHFNYDDIPEPKVPEPTPSSFYWPSQLRRQLSLNLAKQTLNPQLPSTPYTPPPMLTPFRKGPGLYCRAVSQPGTSTEQISIPTTPITPMGEESAGPKINIGREYQAMIPKLRTKFEDDDTIANDELLFSPSSLLCHDERSLEKFEHLNQMNPFLFSPRDSPKSYPLELIYMLLHEYNGDLKRTIDALLDGTAKDIKQCRPIHTYRFLDCDTWTSEEIEAFTKAIQPSEKNFEVISQAIGTKTIKQCIEFYYMPKVSVTARKISSTRTSAVMTRRKRYQISRARQQQLDDEISSSSPFSEIRIDDDGSTMNSDGSPANQISCDIDECSQTFTSKRAFRAHRKDHHRTNHNLTTYRVTKYSRNID